MSEQLQHIRADERWFETAVTGKSRVWGPWQIAEVSDAEAVQLLATGRFRKMWANQVDEQGTPRPLKAVETAAIQANLATEPLVRVGTYTGAGVIDCGIALDAVILVPADAVAASFKHRACWRNNAPNLGVAAAHTSGLIPEIKGTTFTVGANAGASGYWIAIADNGSGKVAVGSYAGNGADNRAIAVGLAPQWVMVKRDNAFPCWVRAVGMTTSYPLSAAASADNIKSLTSTGFTVGTAADINAVSDAAGSGGEAYDYIALAASPAWRVLQFVGNNAARTLTTIPNCAAALLKSHDSGTPRAARIAVSGMVGDKVVTATAQGAGVMSIASGALAVAAAPESNGSGIVNTVLAFREYSGVVSVADTPAAVPALQIGASGGVICVTNNAALNLVSPSPITLELLWKPSGAPASNYYLLGRGQGGAAGDLQYYVWLSTTTGSLHVTFSLGGGTSKSLEYGLTFLDGLRKHLIVSFDGVDDLVIAIDGKRAKAAFSTTTVGATSVPANAKFSIGCRRDTADAVANSCVGDAFALARVYNVVLTDAQMEARYRRAALRDFGAEDVAPVEEWDAVNIIGSTWFASYSSTNNGTISGGANSLVTI